MKPPDNIREQFVRQWLKKAEEDFNAAKSLLGYGDSFTSTVCFHCQQAAEKFLKAFLTHHQVEFPKTHDVGEILDLVATVNPELADSLRGVTALTTYGVDVHYPGDFPAASGKDAQEATAMAELVRNAVLALL